MKRLIAFIIAVTLFFSFTVPALAADDVPVGVSDVSVLASAPGLMAADTPAVMAEASAGVASPASIYYRSSGSSYTAYPSYWSEISLSSSSDLFMDLKIQDFSSSLVDDQFYTYVLQIFFFSDVDVTIVPGNRLCSLSNASVDGSNSYYLYVHGTGSQLKNSTFTFYFRFSRPLVGYNGSGSASLSGSASPNGQGSISSGSASINGSVNSDIGLMTGNIYGLNGYLSLPNYSLSGASVSLAGSKFDPFSKNLAVSLKFKIPWATLVTSDQLLDTPSLVHDMSSWAALWSGQQQKDEQDMQDSYNSAVDQGISEAQSNITAAEEFEQGIFGQADSAMSQINPGGVQTPSTLINSMAFISGLWTDSYNQLPSDFQFVITFPLFLGIALMFIGRSGRVFGGMMSTRSKPLGNYVNGQRVTVIDAKYFH